MSSVREQVNRDGWWSSEALKRAELPWEYFWGDAVVENLSTIPKSKILHVRAIHCATITNYRGKQTIRVILECEEGVYYRDSYDFISQIQMMIDWFGPVEAWSPIEIKHPDRRYERYQIIPRI